MVDYRAYDGTGNEITESMKGVIEGMNATKIIALYLAKQFNKDWVWNENYPTEIVEKIAKLVADVVERK